MLKISQIHQQLRDTAQFSEGTLKKNTSARVFLFGFSTVERGLHVKKFTDLFVKNLKPRESEYTVRESDGFAVESYTNWWQVFFVHF